MKRFRSKYQQTKKQTKKQQNRSKKTMKKLPKNVLNVWGIFGKVFSPKSKTYVRLGSPKSMKVIRDELPRNAEWNKRVKYIIQNHSSFGEKLKKYLDKK